MWTQTHPLIARALAALLLVVYAAGCARHSPLDPARGATITLENRTDLRWELELREPRAREQLRFVLVPREVREVVVPSGHYSVEQKLATNPEEPAVVRHVEMDLERGHAYWWPLATLLSRDAVGASPVDSSHVSKN